jgi:hypothetical protein
MWGGEGVGGGGGGYLPLQGIKLIRAANCNNPQWDKRKNCRMWLKDEDKKFCFNI